MRGLLHQNNPFVMHNSSSPSGSGYASPRMASRQHHNRNEMASVRSPPTLGLNALLAAADVTTSSPESSASQYVMGHPPPPPSVSLSLACSLFARAHALPLHPTPGILFNREPWWHGAPIGVLPAPCMLTYVSAIYFVMTSINLLGIAAARTVAAAVTGAAEAAAEAMEEDPGRSMDVMVMVLFQIGKRGQ